MPSVMWWRHPPRTGRGPDQRGRRAAASALGAILMMWVLATGCDTNFAARDSRLERAIQNQDRREVLRLLDEGVNPNRRDLVYPLTIAAANADIEILKLLLARGAVYERAVDKGDGWSPLFAAARSGSPEAVPVLLDAGADPCARTSVSWAKGLRPSELARREANTPLISILEEAERTRCSAGP